MQKVGFQRLSVALSTSGFALLASMGSNAGGMGSLLFTAALLSFTLAVVSGIKGQPDSPWGPRTLS